MNSNSTTAGSGENDSAVKRWPWFVGAFLLSALVLPLANEAFNVWAGFARPSVQITVHGADVSRLGGAKITTNNFEQVCRGRCDDLVMRSFVGSPEYEIVVWDGAGKRLAQWGSTYIDPPFSFDAWVVGGDQRLEVRHIDGAAASSGAASSNPN